MRKLYLVAILITVAGLMLFPAGCSGEKDNSNGSTGQITLLEHTLAIHEFTGDHPKSTAVITGKAENTGDSPVSSVVITADFYNADGEVIATESATRENVAPYETWTFTIQTTGPDAWKIKRYDISVDTG
jgi:hypothetical protein